MALSTDDQIEFAGARRRPRRFKRLFTLPVSARLDALAAMRGVSSFDGAGMEMLRQIHERGDGFPRRGRRPTLPGGDRPSRQGLTRGDRSKRELARAWEYQNVALPGIHHPDRNRGSRSRSATPTTQSSSSAHTGITEWGRRRERSGWSPGRRITTRPGSGAWRGARARAHNIRTPNVRRRLSTWRNGVVHEGLAEVFTVEVCGPDSTGAWLQGT